MIVLVTQLEVAQDNGDFSACQNENEEHDEQETKDIVELIEPYWAHDEKDLDEHSSEWQDTT